MRKENKLIMPNPRKRRKVKNPNSVSRPFPLWCDPSHPASKFKKTIGSRSKVKNQNKKEN